MPDGNGIIAKMYRSIHGVLITYRRPLELVTSVHAVLGQTRPPDNLIVIDNSGENLRENEDRVRSLFSSFDCRTTLRYLYSENVGPAGGLALAMDALSQDASDDDLLVILDDDDPLPARHVIAALLDTAEELIALDPTFAGVGLKGAQFDRRRIRTVGVDLDDKPLTRVDHLHGGYAPLYLIRALRSCGGPRRELFWGFEELDLGLRLEDMGWSLYMASDLFASVPKGSKYFDETRRPRFGLGQPGLARYYKLRNLIDISRTRVRRRDMVWALLMRSILKPLANIPIHPKLAICHLSWNIRAIKDGLRGQLGRRSA